jgi:hypothetical protein
LEDLLVRGLRTAPQLNSVCPHGLDDTFVEEKWLRYDIEINKYT